MLNLTTELYRLIGQVNRQGNRNIKWVSDQNTWGTEEKWEFPVDSGRGLVEDCDGFTLWKMRELSRHGIPQHALLFTIVRTEEGEGHAVLTVVTDRGDLILDNRFDAVRTYDDLKSLGYRFIYRSNGNLWTWNRIE